MVTLGGVGGYVHGDDDHGVTRLWDAPSAKDSEVELADGEDCVCVDNHKG